jgi:hypothetical protein
MKEHGDGIMQTDRDSYVGCLRGASYEQKRRERIQDP